MGKAGTELGTYGELLQRLASLEHSRKGNRICYAFGREAAQVEFLQLFAILKHIHESLNVFGVEAAEVEGGERAAASE